MRLPHISSASYFPCGSKLRGTVKINKRMVILALQWLRSRRSVCPCAATPTPPAGRIVPGLRIKPSVICCLLQTHTHTHKQTNKCFSSWWLKWHVSGPDCADSFTGSCQHNEPSEASNEAIIVCGMNNQSTVNSVVRILQGSRVNNGLPAVTSEQTDLLLEMKYT